MNFWTFHFCFIFLCIFMYNGTTFSYSVYTKVWFDVMCKGCRVGRKNTVNKNNTRMDSLELWEMCDLYRKLLNIGTAFRFAYSECMVSNHEEFSEIVILETIIKIYSLVAEFIFCFPWNHFTISNSTQAAGVVVPPALVRTPSQWLFALSVTSKKLNSV